VRCAVALCGGDQLDAAQKLGLSTGFLWKYLENECDRSQNYGDDRLNLLGNEGKIKPLRQIELEALVHAVDICRGNKSRAGRAFGCKRDTIAKYLKEAKKLGIQSASYLTEEKSLTPAELSLVWPDNKIMTLTDIKARIVGVVFEQCSQSQAETARRLKLNRNTVRGYLLRARDIGRRDSSTVKIETPTVSSCITVIDDQGVVRPFDQIVADAVRAVYDLYKGEKKMCIAEVLGCHRDTLRTWLRQINLG